MQRQLGRRAAIEFAYVGSRGHDLISARDINQAAGQPGRREPAAEPALRRHHADRVARLVAIQRAADQVSAAAARGLSLLLAYTLGKSTDDASGFFTSTGDPNFPQNSLDPGAEHGRSSFDVRHRFSGSFAYELPLGEQPSGCARSEIQGDRHASRADGRSRSPSGRTSTTATPGGRTSASATTIVRTSPAIRRWTRRRRNVVQHVGVLAAAVRHVRQCRPQHPDRSRLHKRQPRGDQVRAGRGRRLQLRAEAFNLLNRTNLDLPDAFFGSPTFGQVLSAGSPRRIQFGVRAVF